MVEVEGELVVVVLDLVSGGTVVSAMRMLLRIIDGDLCCGKGTAVVVVSLSSLLLTGLAAYLRCCRPLPETFAASGNCARALSLFGHAEYLALFAVLVSHVALLFCVQRWVVLKTRCFLDQVDECVCVVALCGNKSVS